MLVSSSGTGQSADDTLVVVELPPEAKAVPDAPLEFSGLGTKHPRVRLANGVELVGRYEESVGDLLILDKGSEDGARLVGEERDAPDLRPQRGRHDRATTHQIGKVKPTC